MNDDLTKYSEEENQYSIKFHIESLNWDTLYHRVYSEYANRCDWEFGPGGFYSYNLVEKDEVGHSWGEHIDHAMYYFYVNLFPIGGHEWKT